MTRSVSIPPWCTIHFRRSVGSLSPLLPWWSAAAAFAPLLPFPSALPTTDTERQCARSRPRRTTSAVEKKEPSCLSIFCHNEESKSDSLSASFVIAGDYAIRHNKRVVLKPEFWSEVQSVLAYFYSSSVLLSRKRFACKGDEKRFTSKQESARRCDTTAEEGGGGPWPHPHLTELLIWTKTSPSTPLAALRG